MAALGKIRDIDQKSGGAVSLASQPGKLAAPVPGDIARENIPRDLYKRPADNAGGGVAGAAATNPYGTGYAPSALETSLGMYPEPAQTPATAAGRPPPDNAGGGIEGAMATNPQGTGYSEQLLGGQLPGYGGSSYTGNTGTNRRPTSDAGVLSSNIENLLGRFARTDYGPGPEFASQFAPDLQGSIGSLGGLAGQAAGYQPTGSQDTLAMIDQFLQGPQGPSQAQLLQQQASDRSMQDALSLARSARGGPGAQARALRGAGAQNAATQVENARNLGLLQAQEDAQRRGELLQGLGLRGQTAGAADQGLMQALGLAGQLQQGAGGLAQGGLGTEAGVYGTQAGLYDTQQRLGAMGPQQWNQLLGQVLGGEYGIRGAEISRPPEQKGLLEGILDVPSWFGA